MDGSKQWDAAEYLRFSMTDIDSAKRLSVQGYGRIDYSSSVAEGESKTDNRIYYLYADYRGVMDKVDLRVGRQFVNLSAGSGIIDGIQADVKQIGVVGVTIMGGRDIIFGDRGNVTSHAAAGGMALYLVGIKNTDLDVSYYRAYDYSDVSRETLGFNFKQYLLDSVKVYANARYDLTAQVFSEALAGIRYFPKLDLMLTAEYYESYPTFDTTSIYSVFAVDKYKEGVFRADYTALSWLDLSAGYKSQNFGDSGTSYVAEIGFRVRP